MGLCQAALLCRLLALIHTDRGWAERMMARIPSLGDGSWGRVSRNTSLPLSGSCAQSKKLSLNHGATAPRLLLSALLMSVPWH